MPYKSNFIPCASGKLLKLVVPLEEKKKPAVAVKVAAMPGRFI